MLKKIFIALLTLLVFHFTAIYGEHSTNILNTDQDTVRYETSPDAVIYPGPVSGNLNVFEMIQGRVAGVWVTGGPSFYRIRVRSALRPPLVVIDGMRFTSYDDRDLNNLLLSLSPQDIDRIEVHKGIAGALLYPNSGSGVLEIHTKPASDEEL